MATPPQAVVDAINEVFDIWNKTMRTYDVDLLMSLWADDEPYRPSYLLPGQPSLHGKRAIHATMATLCTQLQAAGMTDSAFHVALHCDPFTASDPHLVALVGEQCITLAGGRVERAHGLGTMVKVDGQWKVLTIGMVQATEQLQGFVDELSKQEK